MDQLGEFLEQHQSELLGACRKFYRHDADTWDLLQDSCMKMFDKFHTYDSKLSFMPWARKLILRVFLDQKRALDQEFKGAELISGDILDRQPSHDREVGESIEILLNLLPEGDRAILTRAYLDEEKQSSISACMGISQPALSKRLKKATQRLRIIHDEYFGYANGSNS